MSINQLKYRMLKDWLFKWFFALLLLVAWHGTSMCQQGNIWYFGEFAGLDFNSGSPVALTNSAMSTNEGCASISDINGNLLFYTDGSTVYNSNHVTMANGAGLLGSFSSSQSAIIIPKPQSLFNYFVITADQFVGPFFPGDLHYSEVDMTANGGLGEVLSANKNTFMLDSIHEKITAIPHANGIDVWIVTTKVPDTTIGHSYEAFLVTSAGISATPVSSPAHPDGIGFQGYLRPSHKGDKLACANSVSYGTALDVTNHIYLSDFDQATGVVSNHLVLKNSDSLLTFYGVEFSPNDSILYAGGAELMQFDISSGVEATINNSQVLLSQPGTPGGLQFGALQQGPDGKIYITGGSATFLSVIHQPNSLGVACDFQQYEIDLGGQTTKVGLPNVYPPFVTYLNRAHIDIGCLGDTTFLTLQLLNAVDSFLWDFGDATAMPPDSTSTDTFASHVYPATGSYVIKLTTWQFNGVTVTHHPIIILDAPTVDLGPDQRLCVGDSINLNVSQTNMEYLWQDSSTTPTFAVGDSGIYWVDVFNDCDRVRDSLVVQLDDPFTFDLGVDTLLCDGGSFVLDPQLGDSVNYLWSDASTDTTLLVGTTNVDTVWLEVSNQCDTLSDTVVVTVASSPVVELGNDTSFCEGFSLFLETATDPDISILWSDSSSGSSLQIDSSGVYWLQETSNTGCGTDADTILITVNESPEVDLGPDTAICRGDSFELNVAYPNPAAIYLWQDGFADSSYVVSDDGLYTVTTTLGPCSASDQINVDYLPPGCSIDCHIEFPNVFTPNQDRENDWFLPITDCDLTQYELTIYNRWGNVVYHSQKDGIGWDGSFNGVPASEGVYFWTIDYEHEVVVDQDRQARQGSVTLLR